MNWQLRAWRTGDAPDVALYANNPRIAENLRDVFPHPYALSDAQSYIRACLDGDGGGKICMAIQVDGHVVGSVGVFLQGDVYRRSAELGYWLAEEYWGRGIMTGAVEQICAAAFESWDIVRIFAEPYAHNRGSRRVLEKAGFSLEGVLRSSVTKHGKTFDSCMYALLRDVG